MNNVVVIIKLKEIESTEGISVTLVDYDEKHNFFDGRKYTEAMKGRDGDMLWGIIPNLNGELDAEINLSVAIVRQVMKNDAIKYKFFNDTSPIVSCIIFVEPKDDGPLPIDLTSIECNVLGTTARILTDISLGVIIANCIKQYKSKYDKIIKAMETAVYDENGTAAKDMTR